MFEVDSLLSCNSFRQIIVIIGLPSHTRYRYFLRFPLKLVGSLHRHLLAITASDWQVMAGHASRTTTNNHNHQKLDYLE